MKTICRQKARRLGTLAVRGRRAYVAWRCDRRKELNFWASGHASPGPVLTKEKAVLNTEPPDVVISRRSPVRISDKTSQRHSKICKWWTMPMD